MKLRPVIFWAHLISGISVGAVILVMAVTGILIAFEPQIVDFADRDVRSVPLPALGVERLSAGKIVASAAGLQPGINPTGLTVSANPTESAVVFLGNKGGIFVNPYTGEVLGGISKIHKGMLKLIEIHRWLGFRRIGKPVLNACNVALFFMVLSGLYLWWPQQWNASVRKTVLFFNPTLSGKLRDWNWHNVIGFWCSPLLLVTTLTGMVIAYSWANQLLFRLTGSEPPVVMQKTAEAGKGRSFVAETPADLVAPDFDLLWAKASSQVPEWQTISIRLPREPGRPVTATIIEKDAKSFMRSQLSMNPQTGEVIKWEPYVSQSRGKKFRSWIVPLHTGQAWGIPGQIFAFIGAFGATLLVWTGYSLAWRRFFGGKPKVSRTVRNPEPSFEEERKVLA